MQELRASDRPRNLDQASYYRLGKGTSDDNANYDYIDCSKTVQKTDINAPQAAFIGEVVAPDLTRGEKLDLAEICKRAKLVANLTTKFALSLHACVFEICIHAITQFENNLPSGLRACKFVIRFAKSLHACKFVPNITTKFAFGLHMCVD